MMRAAWAKVAGALLLVQLLAAAASGVRLGVTKMGGELTNRVPTGSSNGWTVYTTPVDLQSGDVVHAMSQYQAANKNGFNVQLYQFLVIEESHKIHQGSDVSSILKGGQVMAPAAPAGGVITPNMVLYPRSLSGFYTNTGSARRVWVSLVVYASASTQAGVDIVQGYGGIATVTHPANTARMVGSQSHLVHELPIKTGHSLWSVFETKLGEVAGYTAATVAAQYQARVEWVNPAPLLRRNAMLFQFLSAHPSCQRYTGQVNAGPDSARVVPARPAGDNVEYEQVVVARTVSGIMPLMANTTGCVGLVAYAANDRAQSGDKVVLPFPGYGGLTALLSKPAHVVSAAGKELVTTIPFAKPAKGWTLYAVKVPAPPGSILQVAMQLEASQLHTTAYLYHMLVLHRNRTIYRGTLVSEIDKSHLVHPVYPSGAPITTSMHHSCRSYQGAVGVPEDWTEGLVWVSLVIYSLSSGTGELNVEKNYGGLSVAVYPRSDK